MSESTCFDIIARWNAESAARIWARAAFSSNDPAAVLDAADESAVAELVLLQPKKRILPATRAIPPVIRISPPSEWCLLSAPQTSVTPERSEAERTTLRPAARS